MTADACVSLIITDLGVLAVEKDGFVLKEVFEGHTVEEIIEKTGAAVKVQEPVRIISYEE